MTQPNPENPTCPKCGKLMVKMAKTPSGRQRWQCNRLEGKKKIYCYSTTDPTSGVRTQSGARTKKARPLRFARKLSGIQRFVVTSVQNATPVHENFVDNLKACAKERDAELVAVPYRYKNPTSRWTESQANMEHWATVIDPYLYNQRKKLNKNLVLVGDVKVQPTAVTPLSDLEGLTRGESGIFAHPKLQLITVPTPQHSLPKILVTTGSCTVRNYTDSKAGKKGEFHHVFGAAYVEISGDTFHIRQINALSDGSFIEYDRVYTNGKGSKAPPPLSLTMGDTHVGESDPVVMAAREELLAELDPGQKTALAFHDLLNGRTVNHHERENPFVQLALHKGGARNVREEVEAAIELLRTYGGNRRKILVPSNHNDWLSQWLNKHDWRRDPENMQFYLDTAQAIAQSAKLARSGAEFDDAFTYWAKKKLTGYDNIEFPGRGSSVMIGDVEHNFHGDKGPNGSRGTPRNMARLGVRVNIGHVHSPAIFGPLYAAGTSTFLDPPYTRGHPGSWLNTDILEYANGKRTLINYIKGKWRVR